MYKIHCMNNIAKVGTDRLGDNYQLTDKLEEADAVMVRSAKLHDTVFPKSLLAIARAGAGVNNIPLERCAEEGIVVFNTPGANANAVKEMVILGMLLACRDIYGGITWVKDNCDDPDISKKAEKAKKQFSGIEIAGKTLGVIGLGAIGAMVANSARSLGMKVLGYDPYLSINSAWSLDRHVKHVMDIEDIYAECDFITCPAVNRTFAKLLMSGKKLDTVMERRITQIIALAAERSPDVLILGAFGCGVFGNRRETVYPMFEQAINRYLPETVEVIFADPR